jgi:dGTPase
MMDWKKLLSHKRLGKESDNLLNEPSGRTAFQQDFDRIVFSSAFRRLQSKTQVFPLPKSSYVRNRLTHSLETASVGRSLGNLAGIFVLEKYPELNSDYSFSDFGAIVSAACLAHDIGNPPFGHSGEDAISNYFKENDSEKYISALTVSQKADLQNFEGNAAGFRIISNTPVAQSDFNGGLGLTYSTYATFVKYPKGSFPNMKDKKISSLKKFSFFDSEKKVFEKIAREIELKEIEINSHRFYVRHPLAFLVEAADDICYTIIDYEDGYQEGLISFDEVENAYKEILKGTFSENNYNKIFTKISKINYLRSKVISKLINETIDVFKDSETGILDGKFERSLLDEIPSANNINEIKKDSFFRIYSSDPVLKIEAAGYRVLPQLLNIFIDAVFNPEKEQNRRLIKLIPDIYLGKNRAVFEDDYDKLLNVTMYISGMTDKHAVELYRQLNGISIGD